MTHVTPARTMPCRNPSRTALRYALFFAVVGWIGIPQAPAQGFPDTVELADLNTVAGLPGLTILGPAGGSDTGWRVEDAGDMNGDGFPDIAIGDFNSSVNGLFSGQVFLVLGQAEMPDTIDLAMLNQPGQPSGLIINGASNNRIGGGIGGGGDLNGDGLDELVLGASVGNFAVILFGRDDGGLQGTLELADFNTGPVPDGIRVNGTSVAFRLGADASWLGDVNGDGLDDIAIGANGSAPGGESFAGTTHVIFGQAGGALPSTIDLDQLNGATATSTPGIQLNGELTDDQAGATLSDRIDLNGDGFDDIVIGAPSLSRVPSGNNEGRVYVVYGGDGTNGSNDLPGTVDLETLNAIGQPAGVTITGFEDSFVGIRAGDALSPAGDINRDGFEDLLIGAFAASPDGRNLAGQTFLIHGGANLPDTIALQTLGSEGVTFNGVGSSDLSGAAVAGLQDFDGDGFGDLAIGAYQTFESGSGEEFSRGAAYVVFGRDDAALPEVVEIADFNTANPTGTPGIVIRGGEADDLAGFSLSRAGDLNGDGLDDLLIGAPGNGGPGGNRAYVLFGGAIDVGITKTNDASFIDGAEIANYTIEVVNKGPFELNGIGVEDILPAELDAAAASWSCVPTGGATCTANGSGDLVDSIDLPGNAKTTYTLIAPVIGAEGSVVVNTASATLPAGVTDVNPGDNSATDSDVIGLFVDGFEPL